MEAARRKEPWCNVRSVWRRLFSRSLVGDQINAVNKPTGPQEIVSNAFDRETDFLLKEYEIMRSEINTRVNSQTNLVTVSVLLLGGIIAVGPFLINFDSRSVQLRLPQNYFVLILLLISTLFTSLLWATMAHGIHIASIAGFLHSQIRKKAILILGNNTTVLNWEIYRHKLLFPKHLLLSLITVFMSIAQYFVMVVPATVSLIAAVIVYLSNFTIPPVDWFEWFVIVFLIFNTLYLLATIPCSIYFLRVYQEISADEI
jgi:hypothetical protein